MQLYAIRRRSVWADEKELEAAAAESARVGEQMADRLRWIRSYVVKEDDGRVGSVCIYQASDPEAIREHGRRIGAYSEDFQPVTMTAIVRNDPEDAAYADTGV
ncbi:MAG: nickel-binding protein [Dichotomicrobium sp.]